ncbi:MAG: amidohydrolase family protein [Steroidobacteraceae bacterium]
MADLKPFLPQCFHEQYETGKEFGRHDIASIVDASQPMLDAGLLGAGMELPKGHGRAFELAEYERPMPSAQRLKLLDEDGVAEELDGYACAPRHAGMLRSVKRDLLPSEQWQRQGFVATTLERSEIQTRDGLVGWQQLTFGSDFPHVEGTWPYTRDHLQKILAGVPETQKQAILFWNAARVLPFDLKALGQMPAALKWNSQSLS